MWFRTGSFHLLGPFLVSEFSVIGVCPKCIHLFVLPSSPGSRPGPSPQCVCVCVCVCMRACVCMCVSSCLCPVRHSVALFKGGEAEEKEEKIG